MSYFRNVENDGKWSPGGTYTFEYWRTASDSDIEYVGSGWYECAGYDGSEYGDWPAGHGPFQGPYTCYHSEGGAPYAAIQWNDLIQTYDTKGFIVNEYNEEEDTWDRLLSPYFSVKSDTSSHEVTDGEWCTVTVEVAEDIPLETYYLTWRSEHTVDTWYFITPPDTSRFVITLLAEELFVINVGGVRLISPADDTIGVHSKDILTAEVVNLEESTVVSSVQLYLNTVKVYDGGPQGTKPYLQWMVGAYCTQNTEYDWYVTATIDDVEYQSETWTFTTAEKQDLHPSFHWWGSTPTWSESPSIPAYTIYFGTDPTGVDLDLIVEDWVEPEWEWSEGEWSEGEWIGGEWIGGEWIGGAGGNWTAVGGGDGTPAEPDWSWYPIEYDTDYYWKIDDGPVYTFTTMAFYTPQWETKYLRLVAAANNKIYYEDV